MRENMPWGRTLLWSRRGVVAGAALLVLGLTASTVPASAGLLGTLACPVVGTLNGVVSAGWDDGATTPPSTLRQVSQAIGADDLHRRGIDGRGVGVALIDSGTVAVPGLDSPAVVHGPDLSFESQAEPVRHLDTFGHGTHMAGIIAGPDGVAPGARLVTLKVAAHDGAADVSQVIAAIDWVVQHRDDPGLGIRVLNLSYGTTGREGYRSDPLAFAVENAWRHGIVTVVAGGNAGTSTALNSPAVDPFVLAVGAADLRGSTLLGCARVARFSNRSSARPVDVVAPGVSIASLRDPGSTIDREHPGAVVDGRWFRGSGTSQAAAVTSGAAALLLQARPSLSPDQVKALLTATASPLALLDGAAEGAGMIDVAGAAGAAAPPVATQRWEPAWGTGSIEQARGGSHVAIGGVELTGERDVMGRPWDGARWSAATAAGRAWDGGSWNGTTWTGACLCATTSGQASWNGQSWTGQSWTGQSWTGQSWTGQSWTGQSWTGQSWTGQSWTGQSWTGQSWTSS